MIVCKQLLTGIGILTSINTINSLPKKWRINDDHASSASSTGCYYDDKDFNRLILLLLNLNPMRSSGKLIIDEHSEENRFSNC